jgi:glutamate synthase domain-containing protein 2
MVETRRAATVTESSGTDDARVWEPDAVTIRGNRGGTGAGVVVRTVWTIAQTFAGVDLECTNQLFLTLS